MKAVVSPIAAIHNVGRTPLAVPSAPASGTRMSGWGEGCPVGGADASCCYQTRERREGAGAGTWGSVERLQGLSLQALH